MYKLLLTTTALPLPPILTRRAGKCGDMPSSLARRPLTTAIIHPTVALPAAINPTKIEPC